MQHNYYITKKRLLTLIVAAIFLLSGIFLRLAYIQVIWGKDLQARAAEQWQRDLSIKAYRGDIVDTNGNLIATTETGYSVYARPQSVDDPEHCASVLADVLELDYQSVYDKLVKSGVSEVTIKRQINTEKAEEIRSYNLEGVYLSSEGLRSYVYGDFLSQVLGFVSSDGVGQTGIEAYYDKYL